MIDQKSSPGSMKKALSIGSRNGHIMKFQKIYFICNEICHCNSNPYNDGILASCEFENAADRLMKSSYQIDERGELFGTKPRLNILVSDELKDLFS